MNNSTPAAFLIRIDDGATVLCARHAVAYEMIQRAVGKTAEIYQLDPDEDEIACQACDLSELQRPRIILPH
jgi:hypothetical protein